MITFDGFERSIVTATAVVVTAVAFLPIAVQLARHSVAGRLLATPIVVTKWAVRAIALVCAVKLLLDGGASLKTKLFGGAGIAGALALLLFSMSLQLKLLRTLIVVPALALSWAGTAVVWQDWPDTVDEAKQCVDDAKGVELIIAPITCTVQGLLGVADVITHSKTVSVAAAVPVVLYGATSVLAMVKR
jgi:hypothetical protein